MLVRGHFTVRRSSNRGPSSPGRLLVVVRKARSHFAGRAAGRAGFAGAVVAPPGGLDLRWVRSGGRPTRSAHPALPAARPASVLRSLPAPLLARSRSDAGAGTLTVRRRSIEARPVQTFAGARPESAITLCWPDGGKGWVRRR